MSQASIAAYVDGLPGMSGKRRVVAREFLTVEATHFRGSCCGEIAARLGVSRDCVSPRVGELRRMGLLREVGVIPVGPYAGQTEYRPVHGVAPFRLTKRQRRERYEIEIMAASEIVADPKDPYMICSVKIRPMDPRFSQLGAKLLVEVLP